MIVELFLMAQAATQPTLPMRSIEALIDSAERQTLPAYEIDCRLSDSRGRTSYLKLEQTGGRGVRGTVRELATMPAWRKFVGSPVSLKVMQDDAGLVENPVIKASLNDMPARIETYRWDSPSRPYDSRMDFRDARGWVMIQLTDTPEQSSGTAQPLVFGAVITRRRDNRNLPGAHLGFCSIKSSLQKPLSQAEEAEYRSPAH